jgi:phage baseplate assembly protein W
MTAVEFLGRGWNFPIAPDPATGKLEYEESWEKVRQSIRIILDTEPNERLMRPTFGCGLRRYLMKPNSVATRALIQRDVERALRESEPRIELRSVRVEPGDDPALVLIGIAYVHIYSGREDNLVYPFYLE